MGETEDRLERVENAVLDIGKKLDSVTGSAVTASKKFGELARITSDYKSAAYAAAMASRTFKKGLSEQSDATKTNILYVQNMLQSYGKLPKGVDLVVKSQKELVKISKALTTIAKDDERRLKKISGEYKKLSSYVKDFAKGTLNVAAAYGIAIPSAKQLIDTLIKYRATQFSISRTQQVFGKGMDDMSSALRKARKETILSNQQFSELVDTFRTSYIGVTQSANSIAKMGKSLQTAFGPNVDEIKKRANDVLGIMNKFPAFGKNDTASW